MNFVSNDQNFYENNKNQTTLRQRRRCFFADENSMEDNLKTYRSEINLWQEKDIAKIAYKNSKLETALKQVFFFFPGTFVLYMMSLIFPVALMDMFFGPSRMTLRFQDFVGILAVFLAAILMTWLGLGDVRKPKHFVIPASIISVGALFGAIAGVFLILSQSFAKFFRFFDSYPFYFLPLALIVPFLAKGWVDGKTENKNFE